MKTSDVIIDAQRAEIGRLKDAGIHWKARAEAAEARIKALLEAAGEAELQITYLHEKFGETGSGNAVLAKLRSALGVLEQSHD